VSAAESGPVAPVLVRVWGWSVAEPDGGYAYVVVVSAAALPPVSWSVSVLRWPSAVYDQLCQ
jgi:hypothetical protein